MKISILTATYNRAKYLSKLYKSIVDNITNNLQVEWLIMDDGSTDETEDICNKLIIDNKSINDNISDGARLQIKYFKQKNQGKMVAINNLSEHVIGDLWIECDSDDFFTKNAFSSIINEYERCKDKKDIYAMAFLKEDQNGRNMGKNFSKKESTMFDLYFKELEDGEKALVFITELRKQFRYELENGERFVTEARMYHKMDKKYKITCVNTTIMVCEYQNEGYSKNIDKQFIENPYGYYKYFYEILADIDTSKIAFSKRLYLIKHYILFTYLTHNKLNLDIKGSLNKLLIIALYIPGRMKSKLFLRESSKK